MRAPRAAVALFAAFFAAAGAHVRVAEATQVAPAAARVAETETREELREIRVGPLVIVHAPPFERTAQALAQRALPELERISAALGLPAPEHAEVHLLPRKGSGDPHDRGLPLGPDWSAGLTLGSRPIIVLRTAEELGAAGESRVSQVFSHELVHLIAIQALDGHHASLPAWFTEGSAAHLAFEWRFTDTGRALRFALGRSFVPLARLRHGFRGDPQRIADAYFQSRAFVGWLVEEHGPERFRELWAHLARHEDFDVAFHRTYGSSVIDQEERWRTHFLRRYAWAPLLTSATTPWLIVIGLVGLGWFRKRRRARARLAAWEEEERSASQASATDGAEEEREAGGP